MALPCCIPFGRPLEPLPTADEEPPFTGGATASSSVAVQAVSAESPPVAQDHATHMPQSTFLVADTYDSLHATEVEREQEDELREAIAHAAHDPAHPSAPIYDL